MKILRKILWIILILVIIALVGVFIFTHHISKKGISNYNENVNIKGLTEEVTVYRDSFAVPHIYAKNEADLYRTVGYVMAQDRLWQMDLLRHVTFGRLSEIFGEDMLETDNLLRALRFPEKAAIVLDSVSVEQKAGLEAFADGVNQYIETHKDKLPVEFSILNYSPEPWLPIHSTSLVGYMSWDLASGWSEKPVMYLLSKKVAAGKLKDLFPDLSLQQSFTYPDYTKAKDSAVNKGLSSIQNNVKTLEELGVAGIFNASNNWAVSGKKSTTGKPIFANDMHLGLNAPGIWYQMHEVVEGKLNVTGVVLPGQPLVVCGHNEKIAWGMTMAYVDDVDFYFETINPSNPDQYKFNGNWKDLKISKEKIKIKGGKEVERTIKFTHRGPIVSEFKKIEDATISMHWLGNEYSNEFRTLYLLNRAENWTDFLSAIKTQTSICQNIAYADVNGNIGLYCAAGIPIRKGNGDKIESGETDEFDWKGTIPFDSLPHTYNPECGYVTSANNKTVSDDYKYHIGTYFTIPYRLNRIRELLNEKEKISVEDFEKIQNDLKSGFAMEMNAVIIREMSKAKDLTKTEAEALEMLKKWDNVLTKDNVQASIVEKFFTILDKNVIQDELGDELFKKSTSLHRFLIDRLLKGKESEWCDDITTKDKVETFADMVVKSYKETIAALGKELGNDINDWKWGKLHTLTLKHPLGKVKILDFIFNLNRGPFAVGGDNYTVGPYAYPLTDAFNVNHGASHRHIYSTADWDKSLSIIPTGISGIPASNHYCDQTKNYVNAIYHRDYISREKVEKAALYKMTAKKN